MKIITLSIVAALALGAGAASAAERLSDAQYVALGRCAGIAEGLNQDAETWDAAVPCARSSRRPRRAPRRGAGSVDAGALPRLRGARRRPTVGPARR